MPPTRIGLTLNTGTKKPSADCLIMFPAGADFKTLVKLALAKLKINHKKGARLFVCRGSPAAPIGTEIGEDTNLGDTLCDGILLAISKKGGDYNDGGKSTGKTAELQMEAAEKQLPRPPRFPFPGVFSGVGEQHQQHEEEAQQQQQQPLFPLELGASTTSTADSTPSHPQGCGEPDGYFGVGAVAQRQHSTFPLLAGDVRGLVREAISGCPSFKEKKEEEDAFISFDYAGDLPPFPDPEATGPANSHERLLAGVQRECRGLVLSAQTGKVLARRFHKFFNANEREECMLSASGPAVWDAPCAEKLDGMLCSPVGLDDGRIVWLTRRVRSAAVESFVARGRSDYNSLAQWAFGKGATPLFEWCPDTHVVGVLRHSSPSLTLLALRENVSGRYISLSDNDLQERFNKTIPFAKVLGKLNQLDVDSWVGREGVVICRPDGCTPWYKLKSSWYTAMAHASKRGVERFLPSLLSQQPLKAAPNDRVWATALADVDDVVAACVSELSSWDDASPEAEQSSASSFLRFLSWVRAGRKQLCTDLAAWANDAFRAISDADAVCTFAVQTAGWPLEVTRAALRPGAADGDDLPRLVQHMLLSFAKASKTEALEALLGVEWRDGCALLDDEVLPESFAAFDATPCVAAGPDAIVNHVLEEYLPRKVATLMGQAGSQVLRIPRSYRPDEGKIKGLWERFAKYDVLDLRVDLQGMRKEGATSHCGSVEHALLLVQYGLFDKDAALAKHNPAAAHPAKGNVAGVLVPTDVDVSLTHLVEAMTKSFDSRRMVKMKRRLVVRLAGVAARPPTSGTSADAVASSASSSHNSKAASANSASWQLYVDLDEVLADFTLGVKTLTGRSPEDQPVSKMWQRVLADSGFFSRLKWMPGAEVLWNQILAELPLEGPIPTILSGLPVSCKKQVHREKASWCRDRLGGRIPVVTCNSKDKADHSGTGKILIDDNNDRRKLWEIHGGVFIHHVSPERTLFELKRTLATLQPVDSLRPLFVPTRPALVPSFISIAVDRWPLDAQDVVVGLDAEWTTGPSATASAALVQLALLNGTVHIIDMLAATPVLKEQLRDFLADPEKIKVGFALDGDCRRLGCDVKGCVDLQEVCKDVLRLRGLRGHLPGLGQMAEAVLGLSVPKSKELQHCDWEQRPLEDEKLEYAALDAALAVQAYQHLILSVAMPPKHMIAAVRSSGKAGREAPGQGQPDFDPTVPVQPLFSAVFLTPASRLTLLESFGAPGKQMTLSRQLADHCTLQSSPSEADLRGLPVGKTCEITVVAHAVECAAGRVRAVKVVGLSCSGEEDGGGQYDLLPLVASGRPHITLSAAPGVKPVESLDLFTAAADSAGGGGLCAAKLVLKGVVGVVVAEQRADPLAPLPPKVARRIREFVETAQTSEQLRFHPQELTATDRALIHEFAEASNLESRSEGNPKQRRLVLVKRRPRATEHAAADDSGAGRVFHSASEAEDDASRGGGKAASREGGGTRRITDFSRFSELNIAPCERGGEPGATSLDGQVEIGGTIKWCSSALQNAVDAATVVIMRGLPGSGKSSVARHLACPEQGGLVTSADSFFESGASGRRSKKMKGADAAELYTETFDVARLDEAHAFCFAQFERGLDELGAVGTDVRRRLVVDNTNSRRCEYDKYVRVAEEAGQRVVILEMHTHDKTTALAFNRRSVHGVPVSATLKMLARWGRDDAALLLCPLADCENQADDVGGGALLSERGQPAPLLGADGASLMAWMSDQHLFHFSKSRAKTHLSMAVGSRPAMFVNVPPRLYDEFLQRYADSGLGAGGDDDEDDSERKFLVEVPGATFKLFFDVDLTDTRALSPDQLATIARSVQSECCTAGDAVGRVLVTGKLPDDVAGQDRVKTGLHVKCPDTVVNIEEAYELRRRLIQRLTAELPGYQWDRFVDDVVYTGGLRMLGSRKVTKAVDKGRVYSPLAFANTGGKVQVPPENILPVEMLKMASIHVQK